MTKDKQASCLDVVYDVNLYQYINNDYMKTTLFQPIQVR